MMKDIKVDTNNLTENDYPELEGKIINYEYRDNTIPAVVIGLNRAVGITIVDANDKDRFVVCVPGPIMPDHATFGQVMVDNYDEYFDTAVAGVKAGVLRSDDLVAARQGQSCRGNPDGSFCAYSR